METVPFVHHAVQEPPVLIGELAIDVKVTDLPAVRQARDVRVDPIDGWHHRHVVVARKDGGEDDRRLRRLLLADVHNRSQAPRDLCHLRSVARLGAHVVGPGQNHNHLGVDAVELAILEAPEDVLCLVGAPSEVGRIPAEEILTPVREKLGIVRGAPSASDRVPHEVDVDATMTRLFQQLLVGGDRILIQARCGPVGRFGQRLRGGCGLRRSRGERS
jgi:hypothetical protein